MLVELERMQRPVVIRIAQGTRPAALFLAETLRRTAMLTTRAIITTTAVAITPGVMNLSPPLSGMITY